MNKFFKNTIKDLRTILAYDDMKANPVNYRLFMSALGILVFVIGLVMSFLNFKNGQAFMMISTLVISAVGIYTFVMSFVFRKVYLSTLGFIIFCLVLFSYYFIIGGNQGFAALWIALLAMFSIDLGLPRESLLLSVFIEIFVILFCWTPLKQFLQYEYNVEFLKRFPIFCLFDVVLCILLGLKIQRLKYKQSMSIVELDAAVKEEHEKNARLTFNMILSMAASLEAKDKYTENHSQRVAVYSRQIAKEMGFTHEECEKVYIAGLVHDIGKIGVPDVVLTKPDRLTDEEFDIIKKHPSIGFNILKNSIDDPMILDGVRYHHEKFNGRGYPEGLSGTDIPLIARIMCVADSFDAMNSSRVYREARSREYILEEFKKFSGTQFDPDVVEVFLKLDLIDAEDTDSNK